MVLVFGTVDLPEQTSTLVLPALRVVCGYIVLFIRRLLFMLIKRTL